MEPIAFSIHNRTPAPRLRDVVEQGVPVLDLAPEEVARLRVVTEAGDPVPASVEVEALGPDGRVGWLLLALPVDLAPGETRRFRLEPGEPAAAEPLEIRQAEGRIEVESPFLTLRVEAPGSLRLATPGGELLDGVVEYQVWEDARSFVGNLRTLRYQADAIRLLERGRHRAVIGLYGRYLAVRPKSEPPEPDDRRWIECELELTLYSFSPVIRLQWRLTSHLRFNCNYCWFERYVLSLPLAEGVLLAEGGDGALCAPAATVRTLGGKLGVAAPFAPLVGAGAGVTVEDGRLLLGGLRPPVDGGFGGRVPEVYRQFFAGMSRTFEASLIPGGDPAAADAELAPLGITLSPEHYSRCGVLPEGGDLPTFGGWAALTERAAEWLLRNQWLGTLWWGEWWREWDLTRSQGVEEAHNGNAALAPLFHYYRTGDDRFRECARRAMFFTFDIQFCKQREGHGPFMHTRRFLLDHQNWLHQRYQRVGGILAPSYPFGQKRLRERTVAMVRHWAEQYVAADGTPLSPHTDGTLRPESEIAMTNFADALVQSWEATGDPFFLEKARATAEWALRKVATPEALAAEIKNWNDSRYTLRGLLPLYRVEPRPELLAGILRIARHVLTLPRYHHATEHWEVHFVVEHAWFHAALQRVTGEEELLAAIRREVEAELQCERGDGTYPYKVSDHPYPVYWISYYDPKTVVAYLPVLAARLEAKENRWRDRV